MPVTVRVITEAMQHKRPSSRSGTRSTRRPLRNLRNTILIIVVIFAAAIYLVGHMLVKRAFQEPEDELPPDIVQLPPELRNTPSVAFCNKPRPPRVCAHGGDSSNHPPNTLEAFQDAVSLSSDCVEIDVARTKDNRLVVMHRRELEQLTGRAGVQPGDYHLSELMALRWPTGESPMMVKDAVMMVGQHVDVITLDIKTYDSPEGKPLDEPILAQTVVELVHETACDSCIVWAKSDRLVSRVKVHSPGQQVGYVVMNQTNEARMAGMDEVLRLAPPEVVAAYYGMVDEPMVNKVRSADKQLYTWTVNDVGAIQQVLSAGVDGIVTNRPKLVKDAIDWQLQRCYQVVGEVVDLSSR